MLQWDGVVMVEMKVDDDPDDVRRDDDDDGDDFPSPGRNFPSRFLPAGEPFSLSVFRPTEVAMSISDPP
jgi:hypothetical protein